MVAISADEVEAILLREPEAGYQVMKKLAGLISVRMRDLKEQLIEYSRVDARRAARPAPRPAPPPPAEAAAAALSVRSQIGFAGWSHLVRRERECGHRPQLAAYDRMCDLIGAPRCGRRQRARRGALPE